MRPGSRRNPTPRTPRQRPRQFAPSAFEQLMDRASCPAHNHARPRFIVHSPGFFTKGPSYGVGFSTIACPACAEDVGALVALQYGGSEVRQLG